MQCQQHSRNQFQLCLIYFFILFCIQFVDVQTSFIDHDTPKEFYTSKAYTEGDNREYELVFSDEFNENGRDFKDGNDPRWCAANKNDYTNAALHFYSEDNVVTSNGVMNITIDRKINDYKAFDEIKKFYFADKKYIQSGMVQSWNKFCFIGGVVEFSAKLPGDPRKGGLWPALWMLGNLARATYVGSSDYVWPFSYNQCHGKVQSTQLINACEKAVHYGLFPNEGRGSPEIDILESMQGDTDALPSTHIKKPYQSTSLQVAPGLAGNRPVLGLRPQPHIWYSNLTYSPTNQSDLNPFFYGVTLVHYPKIKTYQSDAISANNQLNETHFQKFHKYRLEWEPPETDGTGGYLRWYTDDKLIFGIQGSSLQLTQTEIPSEPMYIIMNVAVSHTWGFPPKSDDCVCKTFDCDNPACKCALPYGYCDNFPASFEIDYVRVWQAKNESKHYLGCSPDHRPTEKFIQGNAQNFVSEGQKVPLQPLKNGGAECLSDSDCGSKLIMGVCSSTGKCICDANYTGPSCRSPSGYYDFETSDKSIPLLLIYMEIPNSLLFLLATLTVGFVASVWSTKRKKILNAQYEKIFDVQLQQRTNGSRTGPVVGTGRIGTTNEVANLITSYHDSAAVYAMTSGNKTKDVTYCVVDGRLVDSS